MLILLSPVLGLFLEDCGGKKNSVVISTFECNKIIVVIIDESRTIYVKFDFINVWPSRSKISPEKFL